MDSGAQPILAYCLQNDCKKRDQQADVQNLTVEWQFLHTKKGKYKVFPK